MDELKFIKNVKKYRKKHSFSQETMAKKIGVSLRTYQRIEAGEINLGLKQYLKILNIVNPLLESSLEQIMNSDYFNNFDLEDLKLTYRSQRALDNDLEKKWKLKNGECPMLEHAVVGYWEWNLTDNEYYWSPDLFKIYEIDENIDFSFNGVMKQIAPLDYLNWQLGIQMTIDKGAPFHFVHGRSHKTQGEITLVSVGKLAEINSCKFIFGITWIQPKHSQLDM